MHNYNAVCYIVPSINVDSANADLEIELWSCSHEQVHFEIAMVDTEWLGRSAPCYSVYHGRLHLEEPHGVKVLPRVGSNFSPGRIIDVFLCHINNLMIP